MGVDELLTCSFSSCSGLGYILGSSAKVAAGDWHWALRVRSSSSSSLSSSFLHAHVLENRRVQGPSCRDRPAGTRGRPVTGLQSEGSQKGAPVAPQAVWIVIL